MNLPFANSTALYHLHEMRHLVSDTANFLAHAGREAFNHRVNPFRESLPHRFASASLELVERSTRHYRKPEFGIRKLDGQAVHEETVVRFAFCDLLHFRVEGRKPKARVLVVAPLSGHYSTLLRGTVEGLLPHHDVYIVDWQDAGAVPKAAGPFTLDDYLDTVMMMLGWMGPGTHVIAVCQPAVPVLAAASLMNADRHPASPRSLVLMGGPIDTRINPQAPNELARSRSLEWFERNAIVEVAPTRPGYGRKVYPGFLQLAGFMSLNLDRHVGAHLSLFERLVAGDGDSADRHRAFYDEYLAVMDLPGEYYLETVRAVFQDYDLPRGAFRWRGIPVEPRAIRDTHVLVVEGENDDISGVGQTRAALDLLDHLDSEWKHYHLEPGVGHYGIFHGRKWQTSIRPAVSAVIDRAEGLGPD